MIDTLRQMVEIESPSTDLDAVNRLGDFLVERLADCGASVERIRVEGAGDVIRARYGQGTEPIMILGHTDTVWPLGTIEKRPVRIEGDRLYGPGSFDMKGGLTVALYALKAIHELGLSLKRPLTFFFTSLEELGGKPYRSVLEEEAQRSHCVLVLEPAFPGGAVKTARKGVAQIILQIRGRASHAGGAPHRGVSAITELAHQILRLNDLQDAKRGISINVGVVRGGLRSNVVADEAEAEIDVRFRTLRDGEDILAAIHRLTPALDEASLEVAGGISVPPLERTEQVIALYEQAKSVAAQLGFDLREAFTGGASEGCYTAALHIPTLDGLGPDGDGAHAVSEHVLISSLAQRTALLAGLIIEL
jgi:glutamate carboxypeptidase